MVYNYYLDSRKIKEEYQVLINDESIKHGSYTYYFANQKLRLEGSYYLNQKDGEWKHFNDKGELKTIKFYHKGTKTGIWLEYINGGKIIKRYDYDKREELPPHYHLNVFIKYPTIGREQGIEGQVEIKFLLDKNCDIKQIIPKKSIGKEFDKEVIKAYQSILRLSKKYNFKIEGCDVGERIFSVNFTLK